MMMMMMGDYDNDVGDDGDENGVSGPEGGGGPNANGWSTTKQKDDSDTPRLPPTAGLFHTLPCLKPG